MPEIKENQAITTKEPAAAAPVRYEGFFNSMWADITGIGLTAVAGLVAAYKKTNNIFYQNIKVDPEIGGENGLIEISKKKTTKIIAEVKSMDADAAVKRKTLKTRLAEHNAIFDKDLRETIEANYGAKNALHRFGMLRSHQKWEVAFNTLATLGVSIGALVTLNELRRVENKQQDFDARLNGQTTAPQR